MGLKKYQQKRKFDSTTEPKGKLKSSKRGFAHFVVQMHRASHLHYDFRLELDGTLKSWAVPKGPSLDPDDKRLAMEVEDHPLDYETFEGVIPKGNYGAGTVMVWDKGNYVSRGAKNRKESDAQMRASLAKGHISFVLNGKRLHGEFSLVRIQRGSGKEWLLIKKNDDYAMGQIKEPETSIVTGRTFDEIAGAKKRRVWKGKGEVREERPETPTEVSVHRLVQPMLATLSQSVPEGKDWIYEIKWDGYRAIAEATEDGAALYSRNANSFADQFPKILKAIEKLPAGTTIDGEVVALDDEGRPSFQTLQAMLKGENHPYYYYVFDLLKEKGKDVRELPLLERKKKLSRLLKSKVKRTSPLRLSEFVAKDGQAFFEAAKEQGLEGIIAKKADSPYREGDRTMEWRKIKHHLTQDAVIAGFTEPRGGRKNFGALVLGVYRDGKLVYVGHTGTGFDNKKLDSLKERMSRLAQKKSPFQVVPKTNMPVTWIKPLLIAQIRFHEWTKDASMRAPVFLGLREDKLPSEVVKEEPDKIPSQKNGAQPKLLDTESDQPQHLQLHNHEVKLTHLKKVLWPNEGYTKQDLISYYRDIADIILPYLKDRPQSLLRHPNGIEEPGFFQKRMGDEIPEWLETKTIKSKSSGGSIRYLLCQNIETLLYMANLGCIEINPWLSRVGSLDKPDYVVIDLDPHDIPFSEVIKAAIEVRGLLEKWDVESFVKTSGKKGIHIYIPLGAKYDYEIAVQFAEVIATFVQQKLPKTTSIIRTPAKRKKKIYLDYLQNRRAQTVAAPYSLRPWPGATVSTPLLWREVQAGLDPSRFTLKTIRKRIDRLGDLWEDLPTTSIDISKVIKRVAE